MGGRDANARAQAGEHIDPFVGDDEVPPEMPAIPGGGEDVARKDRLDAGKLGALTGPAFDRMRARRDGSELPVPVPWEKTAAELHGGLWPGCWILVGGTGVGKSQWTFELAYHAAVKKNVPVVYVGLELDEAGLVARLAALGIHGKICNDAGERQKVAWSKLYLGDPTALEWFSGRAGAEVLDAMNAAPFYLVTGEARSDSQAWGYREIGTLAANLRQKHPTGPALLVVDFLQLVGGDPLQKNREDLRERIGNAAYEARMAARKYGMSVLLLSATARNYYPLFAGTDEKGKGSELGKGDPARFLGTGKESGEVEYSADGVLALCRPPWVQGEPPPPVWLAVAKSRTGRVDGWVSYGFDGTAFTEPRGGNSTVRLR